MKHEYVDLGLPSKYQIDELCNSEYTTAEWTTKGGVIKGVLVTSKSNGNSIFLPAAGYSDGTDFEDVGDWGKYWSRSFVDVRNDEWTSSMMIDKYIILGPMADSRNRGLSVRPVRVKN